MESDKELDDLKCLYAELLHDGKRLVQDLTASIEMYFITGALTITIGAFFLGLLTDPLSAVLQGTTNLVFSAFVVFEVVCSFLAVGVGARILITYVKLRKRYRNLRKLKTLE